MPLTEEDTHVNVELEELKRKVVELAHNHSRSFHCGSGVDEALAEVGINPESPGSTLRVSIDFTLFDQAYETQLDLDKTELNGKTHEEQCAWVTEHMPVSVIFGEDSLELELPITVTDLNAVTPPPARLPDGYRFYKLTNGRVAHIVYPNMRETLCGDTWVPSRLDGFQPEVGTPWCRRCSKRADANTFFRGFNTDVV